MIALMMLAAATPAVPVPPLPVIEMPRAAPTTPVNFEVEVRAGSELLWSGTMRVSGQSPASFTRNKTDAPEAVCAAPVYNSTNSRTSLSLTLTGRRFAQEKTGYNLRVTWERPGPAADACEAPLSTRTVALAQDFSIAPGQSVTVTGDAGLSVTLRRR
ncbi:MAG: hypothetical protein J0I80_12110 [Sphingomonas sp.]|nr:hypothetical protein [Sphingomonas sp.]